MEFPLNIRRELFSIKMICSKSCKMRLIYSKESHLEVVPGEITAKVIVSLVERQVKWTNLVITKDNTDVIDEPNKCPKKDKLLDELSQRFSLFVEEGSVVHAIHNHLQCKVDHHLTHSMYQLTIEYFF